jgi:nitronate monooxygenase
LRLDATGQPVYGARDEVDLSAIAATGLPFWLAGGYASPDRAEAARRCGAEGVQVGTAFALCDESGLRDDLKEQLIRSARAGTLEVHTDPVASPSGYPFKVARVPGTVSDDAVYEARQRICDLGFLRTAYRKPDGTIGYRCPSEPVEAYLAKGGQLADTVGRRCLCNGLLAAAGMPQQRHDAAEPAIVTAGDDITRVVEALGGHDGRWSAADVVAHVLGSSTDGDDESGSR